MTEQKSTGQDAGRPIALSYDKDTIWVGLPESFPYGEWQDRETWARYMTLFVYFRFMGDNPPPPDLDWAERTFALIELGQQRFADGRNWDQFLLFYDLEQLPVPATVNAYLGSLPWEEVRELFSGAGTPGIVEGPTVESFEVEGADSAQRSFYFQQPDPEDEALSAHYVYTVRRDGYDIVVQALFDDLATMRDGLPVVDRFVRGLGVIHGRARE